MVAEGVSAPMPAAVAAASAASATPVHVSWLGVAEVDMVVLQRLLAAPASRQLVS